MHGLLNLSEMDDVVKFVSQNGIEIINLCHIPEDGRLKTLSFSVAEKQRIHEILEFGERVDGSSLFSFIEPGKSDIYIVPNVCKAFTNPFASMPTLNILCDYLGEDGKPLDIAPKSVLARAEEKLRSSNDVVLRALAELEFYVIARSETEPLFPGIPERNYHESSPFAKFENLRNEILVTLANMGIATKYGHSEVGRMLQKDNTVIEQHEVEFRPQNLSDMSETITLAKWVVRNVCAKHGASASFSPKIALEHAGTGMHIHLCGLRRGNNIIADSDGTLSADGLKMIGGLLKFAPSLGAFGNTTPVSYLRFIARKESPMHICWSARNRLALIRVPLWWSYRKSHDGDGGCRRTFEYRAPDAFANAHFLFAGMAVAVDYGLSRPGEALKIAENLHAENADDKKRRLKVLPCSCSESAENLEKDRRFYEANGIFSKRLISKTIEKLRTYNDRNLWKRLATHPEEAENLLKQYLHCG
jgi:glutamine synthetase